MLNHLNFVHASISTLIGVSLFLYVYLAFAWFTIARKLKCKVAWLAWIPIANYFLLPILAGKRWSLGFLVFVPIANVVFGYIWTWKIYELRNYPGWLVLISLAGFIPFAGIAASIAALIILGFVAWKDRK